MAITVENKIKVHGGYLYRCSHLSKTLGDLKANFSVYMPECTVNSTKQVPQLYYLSGLTCSDENFVTKAGAFKRANELSIALIVPDTSPRGANIPGEDEAMNLGTGAGFYVNATQGPWSKHYRMYDYITEELPALVESEFAVQATNKSIMGHSMGGHGALMIAIANPDKYKSVSAMAPLCNVSKSEVAQKALKTYLGEDIEAWKSYDATELLKQYNGQSLEFFIDQGSEDDYLVGPTNHLLPENFIAACKTKNIPCTYAIREGYGHSYYYVHTFINEHIEYHAKHLQQ